MRKILLVAFLVLTFSVSAQVAKVTTDGNKIPYYESYIGDDKPILIYLHGEDNQGMAQRIIFQRSDQFLFTPSFTRHTKTSSTYSCLNTLVRSTDGMIKT